VHAAIRPDSWNLPLLLHVLGASILLGSLIAAATAQVIAWRRRSPADEAPLARLSFRTLLFVSVPAWFLMRFAAEWIAEREGWNDAADTPTWLGIGYITAEGGGLLLLISVILAGFGSRRLAGSGGEQGAALVRVSTVLAVILVIAYVIATWAMSGKPS
jgi:hypothetical protein